jgi:hypothetical protein
VSKCRVMMGFYQHDDEHYNEIRGRMLNVILLDWRDPVFGFGAERNRDYSWFIGCISGNF